MTQNRQAFDLSCRMAFRPRRMQLNLLQEGTFNLSIWSQDSKARTIYQISFHISHLSLQEDEAPVTLGLMKPLGLTER